MTHNANKSQSADVSSISAMCFHPKTSKLSLTRLPTVPIVSLKTFPDNFDSLKSLKLYCFLILPGLWSGIAQRADFKHIQGRFLPFEWTGE